MIKEFGLGFIAHKKKQELDRLRDIKRTNPSYRIIDVGGGKEKHVPDKFDFIDACMDMREVNHPGVKHFQGNINNPDMWDSVLKDVEENGKYDYCICTHTLEDISSPAYVASQINKIAKSGIVSFPSKYRECSRFEIGGTKSYRGYNHHRWILTIKDEAILAFPKINLIEASYFDNIAQHAREDVFELFAIWEGSFDFNIINSDWLGPSPIECLKMYKRELSNTDEDKFL